MRRVSARYPMAHSTSTDRNAIDLARNLIALGAGLLPDRARQRHPLDLERVSAARALLVNIPDFELRGVRLGGETKAVLKLVRLGLRLGGAEDGRLAPLAVHQRGAVV